MASEANKINDAVASERSSFSENHDYKSFFRVAVNTYVPIFRDLDARGGKKLRTDTHTHTRDNYNNLRCAHARRGLNNSHIIFIKKIFRNLIFVKCFAELDRDIVLMHFIHNEDFLV